MSTDLMRTLDFYRATPSAVPLKPKTLSCPYHRHWVRMTHLGRDRYRTCPVCRYCVNCIARNRPVFWDHTHGFHRFTEAELAGVS